MSRKGHGKGGHEVFWFTQKHRLPTSLHGVYVTIQNWLWFNWIKKRHVGVWGLRNKGEGAWGWMVKERVCLYRHKIWLSDSMCVEVHSRIRLCLCVCRCVFVWNTWVYVHVSIGLLKPPESRSSVRALLDIRQVKISFKLEWDSFFLTGTARFIWEQREMETGGGGTIRAAVSLRKSKARKELWLLYVQCI